jgi:hypothetical protein
MRVTNKFGVPQPLVTLAKKEYYTKGESQYSVTELMGPPRVRRLREKHDEVIEQDVTDMMWQLLGSALHVVMERGQTEAHISEERLFASIDGVTISGAIDLQQETDGGVIITDYKFTSAWAVMNDKIDWVRQLNIYKYLVETVKRQKVVGLRICALIRDFNRHEKKEGYPAAPIQMVEIPMWSNIDTEIYIKERIELHNEAKFLDAMGDSLPLCSDEERWCSETTYAVKREGRKTAIRVFKSIEEADELAEKEKGYVEVRLGEPKRCTGNYCGVAAFCDQYQDEVAAKS